MTFHFSTESLLHKFAELKPLGNTVDEVYEQLFYQHFTNLCDYAFTILKDTDEAKDIVQTAYIKLWEKRADINLRNSAKTYLYTSVYRLSLNVLRNLKTREEHHLELKNRNDAEKYDSLEAKETGKRIQKTIDQLPERCKNVFYKSRFEGKKYVEIGQEMGISTKTVEVQMGKALKFLREQLSDLALLWIIFFLAH